MLKNIILICDCAHVLGGIENVAFTSAKELVKRHYNVYIFSSQGPIDTSLTEAGVHVICLNQYDILSNPNRLSAVMQGLFNFKAYKSFKEFLINFSPSDTIIHFHCWTKALSSSVFSATAIYNFKIAITLHDYFTVCPNGGFYIYPKNKICEKRPLSYKCVLCNCDSRSYPQKLYRVLRSCFQEYNIRKNKNINIIYISQHTHDAVLPYIGHYINENFYLRNPVSICKHQPVNIWENDTYLFIARLSPEKGAKLFCQAITELGLKGCVLGDGYLRSELEKMYPNIIFTGWVNGEQKDKLIRKGKGLIFPSLWYEGSPLTILEMKSYGIPCIVPDKCAAAEEITNGATGYIFKTGDLNSLKEAILKYEHTNIVEMQKNILSTFQLSDCFPESHVTKLLEIYNTILNN